MIVKRHSKKSKLLRTKRIIRSSCSLMFFKIDVLKKFLSCIGKHQCWSLFSINLQACNFIKKRLQNRCYPANITKNFKHVSSGYASKYSSSILGTLFNLESFIIISILPIFYQCYQIHNSIKRT